MKTWQNVRSRTLRRTIHVPASRMLACHRSFFRTPLMNAAAGAKPTVFLRDYRPPAWRIAEVALEFDLDPAATIVAARLQVEPDPKQAGAPLHLDGWRLVTLDTGERRENASSGYNQRREECARACELLGVHSLREVSQVEARRLPPPLRERVRHVLSDNARVDGAVAALRGGDLPGLAQLLNESHASMRDDMDISTPTVEATVRRMLDAGAAGARLLGGGFGGSVLGLLPPGTVVPDGAREVRPCAGARLLDG